MADVAGADANELLAKAYQHHQAGELPEAEAIYRQILTADPNNAVALHLIGVLAHQTGRYDSAVKFFEHAIKLERGNPDLHYNLALSHQALGQLEGARTHHQEAIKLRPDFAEAHYELGNVLVRQGNYGEAALQYRRALTLKPAHLEALINLGNVYMEFGQVQDAMAQWRHALGVMPNHPLGLLNIGGALRRQGRLAEAVSHYRDALEKLPDYPEMLFNLGNVLTEQGNADEATAVFERALALRPDYAEARFALCLAQLPVLYQDESEIARRRAAYETQLRSIRDDIETGRMRSDPIGWTQPFFLTGQGQNDHDLQRINGSLVSKVLAKRYLPVAPARKPAPGEPLKIGIVGSFFWHNPVWTIIAKGWLSQLDRRRFKLFGYHTAIGEDAETKVAAALCDRFVQGPMPPERWRATIAIDAPHAIIYPDVWTDPLAGLLAAQRSAPVQCAAWGHPDTSGLPTVDYMLSSDLMEPPEGQDHYTERLIRLPNLSIYYEPGDAAPMALTRAELGLRDDATVFWCGVPLYKLLPQFDSVFARIAQNVGGCQFAFTQYPQASEITDLFRQRLDRAFAAVGLNAADFVVMLPRLDRNQIMAAMGHCDVVLDSIGWSEITVALDSLIYDLPIVTMPGALMRGRQATAVVEMTGVSETIATSPDDYVAIATRLAHDAVFRNEIKQKIGENKQRIYRDRACISALEEFLDSAVRGQR